MPAMRRRARRWPRRFARSSQLPPISAHACPLVAGPIIAWRPTPIVRTELMKMTAPDPVVTPPSLSGTMKRTNERCLIAGRRGGITMADDFADDFARVLAALAERGLLLLADQRLPSVATLVAGEPVRGSWWGHARGGAIFAVAQRLEALAPEVVCARLVSGKETYLHRRLWPALVGVGAA